MKERSPQIPAPSFQRYAAEKIVFAVVVLWLWVTVVFVLFFVVPANPAKLSAGRAAPAAVIARLHRELDLGRPLVVQYGDYLGRLLRGNLGYSYVNGLREGALLRFAAPQTLALTGAALVFGLLVGVPVALLGRRRYRGPRRPFRVLGYVAVGMVPLSVALYLSYWVGYRARLLPIAGYCPFNGLPADPNTDCHGPINWLSHLVLPGIALGLPLAALFAWSASSLLRAVDATKDDDRAAVRMAALVRGAKGLVRIAALVFGATTVIEVVFAFGGLGYQAVTALNDYDAPTIQAIVIFVGAAQVAFQLVADLVGAAISDEWRRDIVRDRIPLRQWLKMTGA